MSTCAHCGIVRVHIALFFQCMDAQDLHFIGLGRVVLAYKISSPAGPLRHVGKVIQPPEKCLNLMDSLSSLKALLSRKISFRTQGLIRWFTNEKRCVATCWRMELRLK
jgi:hypothetical protein